jgi:flagellar hook protein FlgE
MIQSLFSGVSGMLADQTAMDVIGNNIANANTTGFKSSTADFTESFLQVTRAATVNQPVGLGVGLGTQVNNTTTNYDQGVFQTTNVPTDMGVNGNGWFSVQSTSGTNYVTRNGDFVEDSSGFLRTPDGNFLMGVSGAIAPTSPTAGFPPDKIQIPTTTTSGSPVASWAVDTTGTITVTGQDGTSNVVGYITLQNYNNNNGLSDAGNSLFSVTPAAGTNQYFQAGAAGIGNVQTGVLEASNVDLATEFSNMMIVQNGFDAAAKVITTSNQLLQTVNQLIQP